MSETNLSGTFTFRKGYAVENKFVIRSTRLSLQGKGLYTLIHSYIEDKRAVTKSYVMAHCEEGVRAFDSSWNELKKKGYLKIHMHPSTGGRFRYEYELLEYPDRAGGVYLYRHNKDGEVTSTNLTSPKKYAKTETTDELQQKNQDKSGLDNAEPEKYMTATNDSDIAGNYVTGETAEINHHHGNSADAAKAHPDHSDQGVSDQKGGSSGCSDHYLQNVGGGKRSSNNNIYKYNNSYNLSINHNNNKAFKNEVELQQQNQDTSGLDNAEPEKYMSVTNDSDIAGNYATGEAAKINHHHGSSVDAAKAHPDHSDQGANDQKGGSSGCSDHYLQNVGGGKRSSNNNIYKYNNSYNLSINHNNKAFKNQIEYDRLMEDKTIDKQLLDMVVKTAVDLTSMPDSYHWTINGVETSVGEIRKQLKRLDCDSMAYLVRSVSSSQKTIRHMQAFLRTSLYNTPDAYALYVKQKQNEASGQGTRDKSTQNWGNGLKRPASRFQNFNQRTYDYSAMEVEFVRKLHQQGRDESRQV